MKTCYVFCWSKVACFARDKWDVGIWEESSKGHPLPLACIGKVEDGGASIDSDIASF